MNTKIIVYATGPCPYCIRARRLLNSKGVAFEELRVDHDGRLWAEMKERSKRYTVPQIFINDRHVGGYDDLWALDQTGELDRLLGLSRD